jgi:hypothetical protein
MPVVEVGPGGLRATPAAIAILRPTAAEAFVLASAFVELGALYAAPDSALLCVVDRFHSAVLVDTTQPQNQSRLPVDPVGVAAALDENLLLLADRTSITAVGRGGVAWKSDHIFTDDLHIRRTDNGRIVCRGWNYSVSSTRPVEITLDARTGQVIAG